MGRAPAEAEPLSAQPCAQHQQLGSVSAGQGLNSSAETRLSETLLSCA
jgi:hypothetical protein